MAHEDSVLLKFPLDQPQPKPRSNEMPRMKKMSPAEAKAAMREAKADATVAKKSVGEAMKAFMESPDASTAKMYREAVSQHIKAVTAFDKAAAKVE